RRPALPDVRAVAAFGEDDLRRHHRDLLCHRELVQAGALFRARPVLGHGLTHLAGAAAAGDRHQPARLLGGAHHAARAVLQDHARAAVSDLARTAALRRDGNSARLTSARALGYVTPEGKYPMAKSPYDIDLDRNPANY